MSEDLQRTVEIKFTFDYYEDQEDIKHLMAYREAYSKLDDIYNMCRTQLKHGDEELSDQIDRLLEDIKELSYIY